MTPTIASLAAALALLAGNGPGSDRSGADPSGAATVPVIDVPTSQPLGDGDLSRRGGRAARIELDDASSTWYRLAYVDGGTRLQVFEHYAASTSGPQADIQVSQELAWRLANQASGTAIAPTASTQLPDWARVRTGDDTGASAGLMFTLAYIDLLASGKLVGDLIVAGTGGIGSDGVVTPAAGVDVKVAAAMLTEPDVIFTTSPPDSMNNVTVIESHHTRIPDATSSVGEWLNVTGFEQAGRNAATHPGTTAVIVVHDLRQALAWLCGRTSGATICAVARRTTTIPIGTP